MFVTINYDNFHVIRRVNVSKMQSMFIILVCKQRIFGLGAEVTIITSETRMHSKNVFSYCMNIKTPEIATFAHIKFLLAVFQNIMLLKICFVCTPKKMNK